MVLALATSACVGQKETKEGATGPEAPDACELVSDKMVRQMVGPTIPRGSYFSIGGKPESCDWDFEVRDLPFGGYSTLGVTVEPEGCKGLDERLEGSTPVRGLGHRAFAAEEDMVACIRERTVKLSWLGYPSDTTDVDPMKLLSGLKELDREVVRRWDSAVAAPRRARHQITEPAAKPNPCTLISAGTARTVGAPNVGRPMGLKNAPSSCEWRSPDEQHEEFRMVELQLRSLEGEEHATASQLADLWVKQWIHVNQGEQIAIGTDRAGVATKPGDGHLYLKMAVGTYVLTIQYRGTNDAGDLLSRNYMKQQAIRAARDVNERLRN